jgi:hypothetical protein
MTVGVSSAIFNGKQDDKSTTEATNTRVIPTDSVSTTTTKQGTSTWHLTGTKDTTTIGMSMHA